MSEIAEELVSHASLMFRANREQALQVDHLHADVVGRSVRGGAITFGAQAIKVFVQIGTVVILSRLLAPQAFGLIAMVAAILEILDQFKDLGLSMATIQKPDITHRQVTALFWINVAIGLALMLLVMAAAPLIADFYRQPAIVAITRWLAAGFLISALATQHWAILRRQMRFTLTASIDLSSEVVGMLVAIGAALAGAGFWALVIQRLSAVSLSMVGAWCLSGWWPGLPRRAQGVGPLLAFGLSVTGNGIANLLSRNLDQVLIGWYWTPRLLGFYERAYKLCMTPVNNVTIPVYSVGAPALSRLMSDPARYRRSYIALAEKLAMLGMPAAAFAAADSDWLVAVLLGAQWHDSGPIVAWLAFGAVLMPVATATGLLFVTQDRTAELLRLGLINSVMTAASVLVGLPLGPVGVAASLALVTNFIRIPFAFWMAGRRGPVGVKDLYLSLLPSTLTAGVVFVVTSGLHYLPALQLMRPLAAFATSGLAAVVVSLLCFISMKRSRKELLFFRTLHRNLRYRKAAV